MNREIMDGLAAGQAEYLAFLERRLPTREISEEVLQSAFVRAAGKVAGLREPGRARAWFYRIVRHALADYRRGRAREAEARERHACEPAYGSANQVDAPRVCTCMHEVAAGMKREYADIVRRVDLEEQSLGEVSAALGILPNNASVRLHRARRALAQELRRTCGVCAQEGCLDCTCSRAASVA